MAGVAAAGRIGQLFLRFGEELHNAKLPEPPPPPKEMAQEEWLQLFRDAYCDQMVDSAEPLLKHAVEGFNVCLAKAREFHVSGPLVSRCEESLKALGSPVPTPPAPTTAGVKTAGTLPPERIGDAVRAHLSDVRACPETAGLDSAQRGGQVTLKWQITPAGEVDSPSVVASTINHPATEQCIISMLKTWTFPKPEGGFVATSYAFLIGEKKAASPSSAGTAEIRGSLNKELVRYGIRRHIQEVKACYEKHALEKNLQGRIMVQFLILSTGEVGAASTQSSTLKDTDTEQCILTALKTWTFPQPQGSVVVVSYPFVLKSSGN
jgi:hypothetical protein